MRCELSVQNVMFSKFIYETFELIGNSDVTTASLFPYSSC